MGEQPEDDRHYQRTPEEQDRALAGVILELNFILLSKQSWRKKARCRETNSSNFILPSGANATEGRKCCTSCTVRQECYDYALANKCIGLWGGVMFTVNSTPAGPAAAPVELKPLTKIQDGKPVPALDQSLLDLFG